MLANHLHFTKFHSMNKSAVILSLLCLGAGVGVFLIRPSNPKQDDASENTTGQLLPLNTADKGPAGEVLSWVHERSDIAPDPKVLYGTLNNGMKYIIMPNAEPPGRVSMRLHVAAGALNEDDDQRGLAHFLEHMVFDGTKSFPETSKLVPEMQRLGIAFGAHANAYTTFDETVYKLDLPNNKADVVELGLKVMRDFADGALLREEDIDQERGVILAEKTSRNSAHMAILEEELTWLLPDSLIPVRFPIGTEETIQSAPRQRFLDFYNEFYVPENITFIYTGDITQAQAEEQITNTFSSFTREGSQRLHTSIGSIPSNQGFRSKAFFHKELEDTTIQLAVARPITHEIDSVTKRSKDLHMELANTMLNRRFARLVKEVGSAITSASASTDVLWNELEYGQISATAKDDDWKPVVGVVEQEMRKVIQHGFNEIELQEAVANLINSYSNRVKSAVTRQSSSLADSLARHVQSDGVFSTPKLDLEILQQGLKHVSVDSCHKAFTEFWDTEDLNLSLQSNTEAERATTELTSLYQQSSATAVEPPKIKDAGQFAYTLAEKSGSITSERFIDDLEIEQLELSNGIRINLKKTDFEKNSILITARFGNGLLDLPKNLPGLQTLAQYALNHGGLGKHSKEDLQQIFAGKSVGSHFIVDAEAFKLSGATTPDDLSTQLQLMCAQLTDPGFRPEADRVFRAQLPSIYHSLQHSENGAQLEMTKWLAGNDSRFGFPNQSLMEGYSAQDIQDWIRPILLNSSIELSIVGDFEPDLLKRALTQTFGTLPSREISQGVTSQKREITAPSPPTSKTFHFQSKEEPANALVIWKTSDAMLEGNISEARRLNILSSILSDRMRIKIREELGDAYSPRAYSNNNAAFENSSYLIASSKGTPEDMEKVSSVILEIGSQLAEEGANQDELDRALNPTIGRLAESLRQNNYWLSTVMEKCQNQPQTLDWARQRDADYQSISLEEINALAQKYLGTSNGIKVILMPKRDEP